MSLGLLYNARRAAHFVSYVARHGVSLGRCPICEGGTLFYRQGSWLRDQLRCARCFSIPRWRALVRVLSETFPNWRELAIHESSPGGPSSQKLRRECRRYVATHYFPDRPPGTEHNGFRSENLEAQTFADASFDLVVTQDVFEHVLEPLTAFNEIARTLRPGGAHVFTVPWYPARATIVRAQRENGRIVHLLPPEYHGNPIDARGSLVVTEWGHDLCEAIRDSSGLVTTVFRRLDPQQGIEGEFLEVFVSRKPFAGT